MLRVTCTYTVPDMIERGDMHACTQARTVGAYDIGLHINRTVHLREQHNDNNGTAT